MKIFKNIAYDIKAIRKYGFLTHIKYLFNIEQAAVHLQTELDRLPPHKPMAIKELDINSDLDVQTWANIVNDAFDDRYNYNIDSARHYLKNHPYLDITRVFILYQKSDPIGTYAIGIYKSNKKIGGGARLAIINKYQRMGLGVHLRLYGMRKLREDGVKFGEYVFRITNVRSINAAFACGSVPQYSRKNVQFGKQQKFFVVRLIILYRLNNLYREYRKNLIARLTRSK